MDDKTEREQNDAKTVLVIPCSGMGKVHGLIAREATYLVTDELAPGQADTVCLALLVKGDEETIADVKRRECITIDGCPKACAEKNVQIAGGRVAKAVQVMDALKKRPGAKPGSATTLTEDGWLIARDVASEVVEEAARVNCRTEVRQ